MNTYSVKLEGKKTAGSDRMLTTKPLFHQVNPIHRLKRMKGKTAFAFGINLLNQRSLSYQRNNLIHLGQEFVESRLLKLGIELNVRKA